jgi:hypothetical protein
MVSRDSRSHVLQSQGLNLLYVANNRLMAVPFDAERLETREGARAATGPTVRRSEKQSQPELQHAAVVQRIGDLAECGIAQSILRLVELGVVGDVEGLGPEP